MNPVAAILAENPVLLGPMAGVADATFRGICKRMGAGLTYTEMVSAKGLHYNPDSPASRALLTFSPDETPCAVQLFGAEPQFMADQAARLAEEYAGDIALFDVNMGCPVAKVVGKGEGSALMRTPVLAAEIVAAIAQAQPLPVTVKIRAGWNASERNAVVFAQLMEAAGAAAVAVHGRTRDQFYRGHSDPQVVADVKAALEVPVIGSGDVFTGSDVVEMIDRTGADAVMIARGAQGNPWVFREARALLAGEPAPELPTYADRIAMARAHLREVVAAGGERAFVRMRKHVAWYIAGMPNAAALRGRVNECADHEQLDDLLVGYLAYLEGA